MGRTSSAGAIVGQVRAMSRAPYNTLTIPFRWRNGVLEFAVFYRRDLSVCQFIAGGGEDDETPFDAAQREAKEEASIQVPEANWIKLDAKASIPRTAFPDAPWPDEVQVVTEHSFAVPATGLAIRLSHEHERYQWLQYDRAERELTWDSNRVALFELNRRLMQSVQQADAVDAASRRH